MPERGYGENQGSTQEHRESRSGLDKVRAKFQQNIVSYAGTSGDLEPYVAEIKETMESSFEYFKGLLNTEVKFSDNQADFVGNFLSVSLQDSLKKSKSAMRQTKNKGGLVKSVRITNNDLLSVFTFANTCRG